MVASSCGFSATAAITSGERSCSVSETSLRVWSCTSFETQFESYKVLALADAEVLKNADSSDRYNRVGEFLARTMVLSYVYYEQFKRSIKAGGFVDPN